MQEEPSIDVVGGNETILVVEDESELLELVKMLLEDEGYRVLTATNGLEAVEVFKQHVEEISLVLTDIELPKLDGWEVYLRMKLLKPSVAVIVATGYLDPEHIDILKATADIFIQKPYGAERILRTIRKELNRTKA